MMLNGRSLEQIAIEREDVNEITITKSRGNVDLYTNPATVNGNPKPGIIMSVKVPPTVKYLFPKIIKPVIKFRDSGNDQIPGDSVIIFGGNIPEKILPREKGHTVYNTFKALSIRDQSDQQLQAKLQFDLGSPEKYDPDDIIEIWLESVEQIEWDNSTIQIKAYEQRL